MKTVGESTLVPKRPSYFPAEWKLINRGVSYNTSLPGFVGNDGVFMRIHTQMILKFRTSWSIVSLALTIVRTEKVLQRFRGVKVTVGLTTYSRFDLIGSG